MGNTGTAETGPREGKGGGGGEGTHIQHNQLQA